MAADAARAMVPHGVGTRHRCPPTSRRSAGSSLGPAYGDRRQRGPDVI